MKKYKYNLRNLECANCANKIQLALSKEEGFYCVNVNFNTLILMFETDKDNAKQIVNRVINKIEPEVIILDMDKDSNITKSRVRIHVIRLIIGLVLLIIGFYISLPYNLNIYVIILAYIVLLYRTAKNAWNLIVKNKTINENFLITISCIGAYLVGEYMEGLMVIILYEIGKILEEKAVNKSRKSIKELMDIKPEYANLKIGNEYKKVKPEEVNVGDVLIVKQGEKIPLDGIVISGNAKIDTSALTGESVFKDVKGNSEILSGCINVEGLIELRATSTYNNSTVSKILELVENATDKKARTETFISKAARIYTPVIMFLAIIVAVFSPVIFQNMTYSQSIYNALIFLVISCPCAIAISVPLSYFSGIGRAAKAGILIKGSDYLDNLKNIKEIVFDKTGTLTTGSFNVSKVQSFDNRYTLEDILKYIAKGEMFSNHPISKAILNKISYKVDVGDVEQYNEISGKGIEYSLNGEKIRIGNFSFVNAVHQENEDKQTIIYLQKGDNVIGCIVIKDEIKLETKGVIKKLKRMNILSRMFTGDNRETAIKIANDIGVNEVEYEMLPQDKYNELEKIINQHKKTNNKVAFVGDGINDSPVLALADIGISMGGVGSQSAIEASDVVIMTDNLDKILEAINISKKTVGIIKQNLIFAIGVKFIVLVLSVFSLAGMWEAIFADVGVTLITILNTLRILKK